VSEPEEFDDEPLEPVPDWIDGESLILCKSVCPRWQLCGWDVQYFDRPEDRDQAEGWYREHWRDNHA
jgi:hypothetical protein